MYIPRHMAATLRQLRQAFPVLLLTGPRQSGKTTLVKEELGDEALYVTFDDPNERAFAREDPKGFIDRFDRFPVILDEIQYTTELLPYLKMDVDRVGRRETRWILTGSQQFGLMAEVSESMAGRVALVELLPFSLAELLEGASDVLPSREQLLGRVAMAGLYPTPALYPVARQMWVKSYVGTYLERDVRQLTAVRDMAMFEALLALVAARHGQELSYSRLAREVGISSPTVKSWVGILEASFIVTLLRPYHANFGKRLVKSPKLYFVDPALVTWLTRQPSPDAALAGPMGGPLMEGIVLSEVLKTFTSRGLDPLVYHWRSHDGLEVDLLVHAGGRLHPMEIKLTATPTTRHTKPLVRFRALAGDSAAPRGYLICRVPERAAMPHDVEAIPWHQTGDLVAELIER